MKWLTKPKTDLFVIIILCICLISCKKKQEPAPDPELPKTEAENVLKENAIYLDVKSVKSVLENTITIDKRKITTLPKVGSIILSGATDGSLESFLRKIVSIEDKGEEIIYHTEYAGLNEAFETLNVKAAYSESYTQTITSAINSGRSSKISNVNPTAGINRNVEFILPIVNDTTLFPGLEINGTLVVKVSDVIFEYVKAKNSSMPKKVLIQVNINTEGSTLEITNTSKTAITLLKERDYITPIPLKTFIFNVPIPIPFGVLLFPIPMKHKISFVRGKFSISGKAKLNVAVVASATMGAIYENGTWKNISSFGINATALPLDPGFFLPHLAMNANFVFLKPVYEISPFGADALKALFSVPNSLDFRANLIDTPNYSLKYSLGISGEVKTKLWTAEEHTFAVNADIIEPETLLKGNWVLKIDKVEILSGNNQVGAANEKLAQPLQVLVKDDLGRPLPNILVQWKVTKGNGSLISDAKTNNLGVAEAKWTLGETEQQEVEVTVKDKEGSLVKDSPLKFVTQQLCDVTGTYRVEVYNTCYPSPNGSPGSVHTLRLDKGGQWTTIDADGNTFTGKYTLISGCGFSYHNGVCSSNVYPNNTGQRYNCNGCLSFKYIKQ